MIWKKRTAAEQFSRGASREDNVWKMWCRSCTHWSETATQPPYNDVIRYATSNDGLTWTIDSHVCIQPTGANEFAVVRPCVTPLITGVGCGIGFEPRSGLHHRLCRVAR